MQRTLTIGAIVIVLLGLGVVGYFYFFSDSSTIEVSQNSPTGLPGAAQAPAPPDTETPSTGTSSSAPAAAVSSRLVKISEGPVVPGEVIIDRKPVNASSSPEAVVHFIERKSGNIFTYQVSAHVLTRISNRTIPGIQGAVWLPSATTTFVRYLSGVDFNTVNTYGLPANGGNGFFLPQNVSDFAVSPLGILMLASGVNGSTASLARSDGSHATTVFTTPLTSLRIAFAGKQYLATTKATSALMGSAFIVGGGGYFTRIAGPELGLSALPSPSGKWVLVSYTAEGSMRLSLVNVATNQSLPLPIATLADKCVWASDDSAIYCGVPQNPPASAYPDDWYQGAVHFSDRIWKIQIAGRYAQLALDFPKETKEVLDATALTINPAGTVLVFLNKNDGSLWAYSL